MTIEKIEQELREGMQFAPHDLSRYISFLSGEYSFYAGLREELLKRRPLIWNEMRKDHKSDKSTDRAYEATTDGIDDIALKIRLKRLQVLITAFKTLLRTAEGQAINSY